MRTTALLTPLIAVALAVLLVLSLRPASQTKPGNPSPDVVVDAPSRTPAQAGNHRVAESGQPQKEPVPSAQGNSLFEPLVPGRSVQEQLEELAQRRGVSLNTLTQQLVGVWSNAWSEELNGSIEFYGRALDANGAPVDGATASFRCLIFPEGQFTTNVPTSTNGFFALSGIKVQTLSVTLTKEGYEEVPGTNEHHFAYRGIANPFQPDSNSPVVFRLRKKANP